MSAGEGGPTSTETLVADLKAVLAKSLSGNLELAGRVRDLVRGIAADAPTAVRDPEMRRALVARWLAFNVASLRTLTDSSLETMNAIVTAAEAALLTTTPPPNGASTITTQGADIVLEGRRGERISAPFLLENHYDRVLDVAFEVEPFRAPGLALVPQSALTLDPLALQLPAKGQAIVHAAVALDDSFAGAVTYSTVIRLLGYDARSLRLSVRVVDDALAARPARNVAPRKAKRKRAAAT